MHGSCRLAPLVESCLSLENRLLERGSVMGGKAGISPSWSFARCFCFPLSLPVYTHTHTHTHTHAHLVRRFLPRRWSSRRSPRPGTSSRSTPRRRTTAAAGCTENSSTSCLTVGSPSQTHTALLCDLFALRTASHQFTLHPSVHGILRTNKLKLCSNLKPTDPPGWFRSPPVHVVSVTLSSDQVTS